MFFNDNNKGIGKKNILFHKIIAVNNRAKINDIFDKFSAKTDNLKFEGKPVVGGGGNAGAKFSILGAVGLAILLYYLNDQNDDDGFTLDIPGLTEEYDDISYIENSSPELGFKADNYDPQKGDKVVNSESLAYGLIYAVEKNDKEAFSEVFDAIFKLSKDNFSVTRLMRLVPWAVIIKSDETLKKGEDRIQFARKEGESLFGNASAADADIDMLYALIVAKQKGWTNEKMDFFIHQLADGICSYVIDINIFVDKDPYYVLSPGSLVEYENEKEGTVKYYPSYPNYKYLQVIADYFKPKYSNDEGSDYFYRQFINLKQSSIDLNNRIFNKYFLDYQDEDSLDISNMPKYVIVSMDKETHEPLIKSEKDSFVGNVEANIRLAWRTGDNRFKVWQQSKDYLRFVKDENTYGKFMKEFLYSDSVIINGDIEVTDGFDFDDINPNNVFYKRDVAGRLTHWKSSKGSELLYYNPYKTKFDDDVNDISNSPDGLEHDYKNGGRQGNYSSKLKYSFECFKSVVRVEQGIEAMRNTLSQMLREDKIVSSVFDVSKFINFDVEKAVDAFNDEFNGGLSRFMEGFNGRSFDIVSKYIELLTDMRGYSPGQIFQEIESLLGVVPKKNSMNTDNKLLRSLYIEKIMYMSHCTNLERKELAKVAKEFGLLNLYETMLERLNHMVIGEIFYRAKDNGSELVSFKIKMPNSNIIKKMTVEEMIDEGIATKVNISLEKGVDAQDYLVINKLYRPKGVTVKLANKELRTFDYPEFEKVAENNYQKVIHDQLIEAKNSYLNVHTDYIRTQVDVLDNDGKLFLLDTENKTVDDIKGLIISNSIKELLCKEIIKKDLFAFKLKQLDANKNGRLSELESKNDKGLIQFSLNDSGIKQYLYQLPSDLRSGFIMEAIYDSRYYIDERIDLVMDLLETIDTSDNKGMKQYLELLNAYALLTYEPIGKLKYQSSVDYVKLVESKANEIGLVRDSVSLLMGTLIDTKNENLQKFVEKFNAETYVNVKNIYRKDYSMSVVRALNISYWLSGKLQEVQSVALKVANKDTNDVLTEIFFELRDFMGTVTQDYMKHLKLSNMAWQDNDSFFASNLKINLDRKQNLEYEISNYKELSEMYDIPPKKELKDQLDALDFVERPDKLVKIIKTKIERSHVQGDFDAEANLLSLLAKIKFLLTGEMKSDSYGLDIMTNSVFTSSKDGSRPYFYYYQEVLSLGNIR